MAWRRPGRRQAVYQHSSIELLQARDIWLWCGAVESQYNEATLYIWLPATSMNVVEQNVSGPPSRDDRLDGFH